MTSSFIKSKIWTLTGPAKTAPVPRGLDRPESGVKYTNLYKKHKMLSRVNYIACITSICLRNEQRNMKKSL